MMAVPMFKRKNLDQDRALQVAKLNNLVSLASYNAIITSRVHRIFFDLQKSKFYLEQITDQKDSLGQDRFEATILDYQDNNLDWDKNFKIKSFQINDQTTNLLEDLQNDKLWFYIMPDGTAQSVKLKFTDLAENEKNHEVSEYSLILNPFAAQFRLI